MGNEQYNPAGGGRAPRPAARIVAPFVAGLLLLTAFAIACCLMLSATRAYVGGESHWSKARSLAIEHLRRYARTGEPEQLRALDAALAVPRGDQRARLALQADSPDDEVIRRGFQQGGVHVADIPAMVVMFRVFQHTPLMRPAVTQWERGDQLLAELAEVATEMTQAQARAGRPAGDSFEPQLRSIEGRLLAAERQFSQSLGESSRLAVLLCSAGIGLLGAILAWSGSAFALRAIALNRCNEERVRAANRRWALATAADGLGMVEWSLVGDTVELDTQACALYGLAPRPGGGLALRRKELRRVVHPDDLPEVRATVERCLLTGDDYKHAYRILLPGGGVRHIEVTGRFDADEGAGSRKAPARMVGIVRDVSREVEFRRLEAEKLAAEAAERHRAQLLSRVSHELRTPLNAVMGFSQLLALALDQRKAPDRAHLRHIETAAGHLLGLVDDLLDLTAMQAGDTGAEHRLLDLAMVIDSSLAMVEHQQIAAGVTVHHERPPSAVRVLGNEQRLRQVFVNLLSNGCKYNRPQGRLSVSYRFGGDGVMVDLQDQGLGLTPEQIKELFQPFRRLHRAGDRPGTGLGLVIAKSAVEQVGGRIEVASRPGTGSVFTVSLPTAEGESGLPDLPRLPVLLHSRVEDDRTLLLLPAVSSGVRAARPPTRRPA